MFEQILPFLDAEYRRKISYSINLAYHGLICEGADESSNDFLQVRELHRSVARFDMFSLELHGHTNTRINPFDV